MFSCEREREKKGKECLPRNCYICADAHIHKRFMLSNLTGGIYLSLTSVAFKFDASGFDSQLQNQLEKIL